MRSEFEKAMDAAASDRAQLELLHATLRTVKYPETFRAILIGVLTCVLPREVWNEAISRALKSYYSYKPEERRSK
jgi:hypothetical protein